MGDLGLLLVAGAWLVLFERRLLAVERRLLAAGRLLAAQRGPG